MDVNQPFGHDYFFAADQDGFVSVFTKNEDVVTIENLSDNTWRSIRDQIPKTGDFALVRGRNGKVGGAKYIGDGEFRDGFGNLLGEGYVTHWKPWKAEYKDDEP